MRKALSKIKSILVWLMVAIAIGMMIFTITSVNTFDRNNRSIFGFKFFIVRSDSMSATDFQAGDIVIIKKTDDPSKLKEGDIIAYISQNEHNYGETVTHKIRAVTTNDNGDPGFITYGTTTGTDDETVVTYPYVLGQYTGHIPKLGKFFAFLKTVPGYLLFILVPFLLLISYNGISCIRLFRRHKQEQLENLQIEKDKLAQERKQSEKAIKELQELKAQIEQYGTFPQQATAKSNTNDLADVESIVEEFSSDRQ